MVLIILILVIFILPRLLRPHRSLPTAEEIAVFNSITDSLRQSGEDSAIDDRQSSTKSIEPLREVRVEKATMFYFDPNLISMQQWLQLGIKERTAITIKRYLAKGGHFRSGKDLAKIYGLRQRDLEKLVPYVRIESGEAVKKIDTVGSYRDTIAYTKKKLRSSSAIDVNSADSSTLISLPGIGPKLANRIIHFRERLGGFYSIEQVKETYGLPDSTFERIRPLLVLGNRSLVRININLADAAQLKGHPYFTWTMANAVVQYRKEHGHFSRVEDLEAISAILPDQLRKLIPYLSTY